MPDRSVTHEVHEMMKLANQAALESGYEYIDLWHVLDALLCQGIGIGGQALTASGIGLARLRALARDADLYYVRRVSEGKLPSSSSVKDLTEHADEEAAALKHDDIGTEHILLALLRDAESQACKLLTEAGVSLETLRDRILMSSSASRNPDIVILEEVLGTRGLADTARAAREKIQVAMNMPLDALAHLLRDGRYVTTYIDVFGPLVDRQSARTAAQVRAQTQPASTDRIEP